MYFLSLNNFSIFIITINGFNIVIINPNKIEFSIDKFKTIEANPSIIQEENSAEFHNINILTGSVQANKDKYG